CQYDVSAISPNTRQLCPRAKHSSQGSSSAASAARKSLSSPRTWSGWIPEDRR
ncbi:hypothetical protein GOA61_25465, partial [Sinorhizobium meliloti]|nr:hypothetical protein [Sinorhizobium meliloti]MDW9880530.1 hypothetical protein [Sinorhizobium meliloti]